MRMISKAVLGMIIAAAFAASALAMDMEALDRVSVLMPKSKVRVLIGNPDQYVYVGDLEVELYQLRNMDSMIGTACLYENRGILVGQMFFFTGKGGYAAMERLMKNGYTLVEGKDGAYTLTGKDDDTGQPLMAVVFEDSGLTVVMTFERYFYDRQIKPGEKKS